VSDLAFGTVRGTVPVVSATVEVGADGRPVTVQATLDLTGIATGSRKRDRDLQKPHLLDTGRHPRLTFTGTPLPAADGWQIPGRLTGRAPADVTLLAHIDATAPSGEITVRAVCTFDRRDLGIRAPRLLIGRYVAVAIEAVFVPPA
jgi:polyisoprenoid-binding protein YceI